MRVKPAAKPVLDLYVIVQLVSGIKLCASNPQQPGSIGTKHLTDPKRITPKNPLDENHGSKAVAPIMLCLEIIFAVNDMNLILNHLDLVVSQGGS